MAGLNLKSAQRNVNRLMNSACRIWSNQDHALDADVDPVTLKVAADEDRVLIYDGPCLFTPKQRRAQQDEIGGIEAALLSYDVKIPAKSNRVVVGNEVEIYKCPDPKFRGTSGVVTEVPGSSFFVWRAFSVDVVETSRG